VTRVATTLENVIVLLSSTGKVWKVDRVDKTVTIYGSEALYAADNPVGSLPMSEFLEVFEFVRDISK
jgi:hypothetical protein